MAAKYDRIADDLRKRITEGELSPGERLPAETDLMDHYRVALNTLRRAVDLLAAEGLVEKRQGVGTWVRKRPPTTRRHNKRYQWEKDRVHLPEHERGGNGAGEKDTGLSRDDLNFRASYTTVEANEDLAAVFGVPVGTRMLRREYHTTPKGQASPLFISRGSFLLYDMVAANPDLLDESKEPWPGGTQHQLFTIGIELARIIDEVSCRPPSAEEARIFDFGTGISVFEIRKISIDTMGRVVEVSDTVWPGDRVDLVYTSELQRWPA
jgi:GntR family transcriptional regulator